MIQSLRQILLNNNELDLDNQNINTENDLKCILFDQIRQIQNIPNYEIHSEEADIGMTPKN